ncbi:MAG: DUF4388 domain-containing protein [Verrucomicrobiae bacterium]|nr:DUF4388 domain-containing protein [Verrucomicrobiae bacterium]
MMHLDWNPERTFFISKPYSLEVLKQSVRLKFVEYEKRSESVPEGKIVAVPFGDKPVEPREKIKLGYLSSLPLGDLLQMLCMSRWSGTVEVTELASEISGKIMIDSGDIIHALCGKDEPQAACTHMLNWGRCSFHFDETPPTVERTLRLPYQEIMLNAMRVKDELDGLAAG